MSVLPPGGDEKLPEARPMLYVPFLTHWEPPGEVNGLVGT